MLLFCNDFVFFVFAKCTGDLSLQKLSDTVLDFNSTQTCPGSNNKIQTSISFQCGKTMVRLTISKIYQIFLDE